MHNFASINHIYYQNILCCRFVWLIIGTWEVWCSYYICNFETYIKARYLKHFLWNCPQANAMRPHWISVGTHKMGSWYQSTLVHVMAWCRQATSHYISQYWSRSMLPYGITRPQWVNIDFRSYVVYIDTLKVMQLSRYGALITLIVWLLYQNTILM